MDVGTILAELAAQDPDRPMVTCEGRTRTRGDMEAQANRLARSYRDFGVGPGDRVAIALPNGIEFYEACHGVWKLGAVPLPVSPKLPQPERQQIVELAEPVLVIGVGDGAHGERRTIPIGFEPVGQSGEAVPAPPPSPTWKLATSGGSTGRPKLIVPAQSSRIEPGVGGMLRMAPDQVQLVAGPLYHASPFNWSMYGSFLGHHLVVLPRFDAEAALDAIQDHSVQWTVVVPTMLQRMWRAIEANPDRWDLSSLETMWHMAAPCPVWLKERWIALVGGDRLYELYGTTEGIALTSISGLEWMTHRGSVGRPLRGEIKIVAEDGDDAPPGAVGEVYMRKTAGAPSYRYIGAEARTLGDGWESHGDMGWIDAEGYVYLTDRRTDMILIGGANVYPAEIEAAILEHPAVLSCAVVGLPDDDLGHRLHAVVEAVGAVSEDELQRFLAERIARNKVPRTIRFVDHPLRDDAGKVRRSAVRDEELARFSRSLEPDLRAARTNHAEVAAPERPVGLRERKKDKTRSAIKKQAFRLFRKQGYESTTVEQIAAATEISPSTFFRYFPTKESVLFDDANPLEIVGAFGDQPADLSVVQAMHSAAREVFHGRTDSELASLRERNAIALATPELRGAYMDHLFRLMSLIADTAARRSGRDPGDLEVQTFAWVVQGAMTAASAHWTVDPRADLVDSLEQAFAFVESGLSL